MSRIRWVLYVDLDQIIAAVEVLRRPELAGKRIIVGKSSNWTGTCKVVACLATLDKMLYLESRNQEFSAFNGRHVWTTESGETRRQVAGSRRTIKATAVPLV